MQKHRGEEGSGGRWSGSVSGREVRYLRKKREKGMYEGSEEGTVMLRAPREPDNLCTLYG